MDEILKNTTCFAQHEKYNVSCDKKICRQWMESEKNLNCALLAAKNYDQGMILEDVGKIFNVTRMRVCQIEKSTLNKLNSNS